MIPLSEINTFSKKLKVPAETIEKDYIISWILYCLSRNKIRNDFVFYGGTAIKRIYFEEHRFSEDIDLLSTKKFSLEYIIDNLNLEYAQEEANISLTISKDKIINDRDRAQIYVNYSGFDEIVGAPKEIRLDFAMNREISGQVNDEKVITTYSDLKNQSAKLRVMTLNSILANKFGLLIDKTRNEPRDLFDIWFLLNRLEKFDYDFKKMCDAFRDKYSIRLSGKIILTHLKNESLEKNWSLRLAKQIPLVPNFDKVAKEIEVKVKNIFFEEFSGSV